MSPRKEKAPVAIQPGTVPTEPDLDHKGKVRTDKDGNELRRPVTTDISYPTWGGEHERIGPTVEHIVRRDPPPEADQPAEPAKEE